MSSNRPRMIAALNPRFLKDIVLRVRLVLRLMGDRRVNPFFKLIPIATILYVIWPIDIPGPFDDAGVLVLGNMLFLELCPKMVVQEHLNLLRAQSSENWGSQRPGGDVIDGEFRETTDPSVPPRS
ncbi:MAG TPA: hypothetical protein VF813_06280 [Anaerolineaceae bacterium]